MHLLLDPISMYIQHRHPKSCAAFHGVLYLSSLPDSFIKSLLCLLKSEYYREHTYWLAALVTAFHWGKYNTI